MSLVMEPPPLDSISAQQRECLRLVWQQLSSKEIALRLGISKNTVDGYIAEAVIRLGARDRRHAARICFSDTPPDRIRGDTARVAGPAPTPADVTTPKGSSSPFRLPLRRMGATDNDLTKAERLIWIPVIGIAIAVGFGMLAVGLRSAGDVLLALRSLGR